MSFPGIDWKNWLSIAIILIAAVILLISFIQLKNINALIPLIAEKKRPLFVRFLAINKFLVILFLCGYLLVTYTFATGLVLIGKLFVSLIFLFGAIFVLLAKEHKNTTNQNVTPLFRN
ncbi:hypothetical protein ACFL6N_02475 [Thermodesulfobacteriota bacterium]